MNFHGGLRVYWQIERRWDQLVDGFGCHTNDFVVYFRVSRLSTILEHGNDMILLVLTTWDCLGENSKQYLHLGGE